MTSAPGEAERRLVRAEQQGLRLAIGCRTAVTGLACLWYGVGVQMAAGVEMRWAVVATLFFFTLIGLAHLAVIGGRFDRWWMKYAVYALDVAGICALFALLPVSRGADVPQIIAFRAYGIYYLFPLVVMAALSLSWRLVLWTGFCVVLGWWAAFFGVVAGMDQSLSWSDMPSPASRADYEAIFLSIDFIGRGNRMEETGLLFLASAILALAVWRSRAVFFAQVAADLAHAREQAARERVSDLLGRYIPEEVAQRLIDDPAPLEPRVGHGCALVMDVAGFTARSAGRDPKDVIAELDKLLSAASDVVAAEGGVVITYLGDGLLATFNMPLELDQCEVAALRAARALLALGDDHGVSLRVGVASGEMASGNVGSSRRQSFTVYGDPVNRAARLEAAAKDLGVTLLVDAPTARAAGPGDLVPLEPLALRGLGQANDVFGLPPGA